MNNTKSKTKKKEKVTPEETAKEEVTEVKTTDKKPKGTSKSIPIEKLVPFPNHPYKVTDDEAMDDLIESIKTYGVLEPISVRPLEDSADAYEIISGHRRSHAALRAGLNRIPALVYDVDRDDATIMLVDSNYHREVILPSEKAFSYRMKAEALSHQGKSLTSSQLGTKLRTDEIIANDAGESRNQIQRYIRLTNLVPELLDFIDEGKMGISPAYEISFLSEDSQRDIVDVIDETECFPSHAQTRVMKQEYEAGTLDHARVRAIMLEPKPNQKEVFRFSAERLRPVMPEGCTPKEAEDFAFNACKFYASYLEQERIEKRYER